MRELRTLVIGLMVLTFVGGVGTGAWIGSLRADPDTDRAVPMDRRVQEFTKRYELSPSNVRELRTILHRHDRRITEIRHETSAAQLRKIMAQEDASRQLIRALLTEDQRRAYDEQVRGRRGR